MPFKLLQLLARVRSPWRKPEASPQAGRTPESSADDDDFAYQLQAFVITDSDTGKPVPPTAEGDLPEAFRGYRRNGKTFSVSATDSHGIIVGMTLGWICECTGHPAGIVVKACEVNEPWDKTPLRQVMIAHLRETAAAEFGITKIDTSDCMPSDHFAADA